MNRVSRFPDRLPHGMDLRVDLSLLLYALALACLLQLIDLLHIGIRFLHENGGKQQCNTHGSTRNKKRQGKADPSENATQRGAKDASRRDDRLVDRQVLVAVLDTRAISNECLCDNRRSRKQAGNKTPNVELKDVGGKALEDRTCISPLLARLTKRGTKQRKHEEQLSPVIVTSHSHKPKAYS